MNLSIRVASSPGEAHVAVVEGRRLVDYALWRRGAPDGVGDLHRGRVIARVPAMAGAFVALAHEQGFLPDSEGAKGLTSGTILAVRITRAAQGNKGPRLSACVGVADGPVGLIERGPDPVARFRARYTQARVVVDDPALAAELRATVGAFEDEVAEAVEALTHPTVTLPNGAVLSIWPTPALVAIDVDAGGSLVGQTRHEGMNRAVLPALVRQIRLRNLSGAIVVDLAGMSTRTRAALGPDFVAALAEDPLRPRFLGFTALGLAEIVRARVHPPLHELLTGPLAAGLAALRAVLAAFDGDPRAMPGVRAHPAVVSALQADPVALPDLARRTGRAARLRADPSMPPTAWTLEKDHD